MAFSCDGVMKGVKSFFPVAGLVVQAAVTNSAPINRANTEFRLLFVMFHAFTNFFLQDNNFGQKNLAYRIWALWRQKKRRPRKATSLRNLEED
jgi:hypothetical protein